MRVEPFGFCLRDDDLKAPFRVKVHRTGDAHLVGDAHDSGRCCGSSPSGLCFVTKEQANASATGALTTSLDELGHCLNVRRLIQQRDRPQCFASSDECAGKQSSCYVPLLAAHEQLLIIEKVSAARVAAAEKQVMPQAPPAAAGSARDQAYQASPKSTMSLERSESIVLIGSGQVDLLQAAEFTSYQRKSSLIPIDLPDALQSFLLTCAGISIAIALVNVVPCVCLDGEKIVYVMLASVRRSRMPAALVYVCSLLVIGNVVAAFGNALL